MNEYEIGRVFEAVDFSSSAARVRIWDAVIARIAGGEGASGELGGRDSGGMLGGRNDCDESDGELQFSVLTPEQLDLLCAAGDPALIRGILRDL